MPEQAENKADMAQSWHLDKASLPCLSASNNANIRRVRQRIEELSSQSEFAGWTFPEVEAKSTRLKPFAAYLRKARCRSAAGTEKQRLMGSQPARMAAVANPAPSVLRFDRLSAARVTASPYQLQPFVKRENKKCLDGRCTMTKIKATILKAVMLKMGGDLHWASIPPRHPLCHMGLL